MEESQMSEKLFDWLLRLENVLQALPSGDDVTFKILSEIRQEMRTELFAIGDENADYYKLASGG